VSIGLDEGQDVMIEGGTDSTIVGNTGNGMHVKIDDDSTHQTLLEVVASNLTFIGKTKTHGGSTSAAIWQLQRVFVVSGETHIQFADSAKFTQKWDDRLEVFPPLTFTNFISATFDGTNEYLNAANATGPLSFGKASTFSFSMWVKISTSGTHHGVFSKLKDSPTNQGYEFRVTQTTGRPIIDLVNTVVGNKQITVKLNTDVTDGTWHHLVMTYDGTSLASGVELYLDSVKATGGNRTVVNDGLGALDFQTTESLMIGSRRGAGLFYNGNMDEYSVWNVELTQTEINDLYNSGKPKDLSIHSKFTDLLAWWRMGEAVVGSKLVDQAGANDATMNNMGATNFVEDVP